MFCYSRRSHAWLILLCVCSAFAVSWATYSLRDEPGGEDRFFPFDMGFLKTVWPILLSISIALCIFSLCSKCLYRFCRFKWPRTGGRSLRNRLLQRNPNSVPIERVPNRTSGLPSIFPVGRRASSIRGTAAGNAIGYNQTAAAGTATAGSAVAGQTNYYPQPSWPTVADGAQASLYQVPASVPQTRAPEAVASAPPRQVVYGTYGRTDGADLPPPYQHAASDAPPPYCSAECK